MEDNQNISRKESIDLDISEDKMSVSIIFHEPVNDGGFLSKSDIERTLNGYGIRYGIDESLIENLTRKKDYETWYEVAKGDLPHKGIDGYIEYFLKLIKKFETKRTC